jgi:tRNA pseudouridine55 synthase
VAEPQASGFVVVDKPAGMTSHDVVGRLRRLARTRRVGHGGTLDPMATGVLIVAVNRATRLLTYVSGSDKAYAATVRLGQSTVTDDAEGGVTGGAPAGGVTRERVEAGLAELTGEITQVPSAVSAIKVNGQRAYKRVRDGEEVALPPRPVTVSRLDLVGWHPVDDALLDVDIEVECGSGTYVRALARDLGQALGVGGHLTALRRTRVGGFGIDEAVTLVGLQEVVEKNDHLDSMIMSLEVAAGRLLPLHTLDDDASRRVTHGNPVALDIRDSARCGLLSPDGRLLAIAVGKKGLARPEVVLAVP